MNKWMEENRQISLPEEFQIIYEGTSFSKKLCIIPHSLFKYGLCMVTSFQRVQCESKGNV